MKELVRDAWHSLRGLRKKRGFTVIVILMLGLGIGANTAIFSVVYGVLLRPLPYPQPDRLVQISIRYNGQLDYSGFDAREFDFWRAHGDPFSYVSAVTGVGFNLSGDSEPLRIRALRVSKDYFRVMGALPMLGREFTADEDTLSGPNVAILSYGLWKSQFGGDASLVGKTISLDNAPYTVVGVMPAGFQSISLRGNSDASIDLWTTIGQVATGIGDGRNYDVIARLKPGISHAQANSYLAIAKASYAKQFGSNFLVKNHASFSAEPLRSMISFGYSTPLLVLFGAIGFVLLIACANVANLLLARASERNHEFAIRTALGASRKRLIGQLLTESIVLALLGGAAGLLIAYWGLDALMALAPTDLPRASSIALDQLMALAPTDLPRASSIALDQWAFGFTFLISIITGILFGLAPALRGSRVDLNSSLKEAGRTSSGVSRGRFRSVLAIAEIALSFILLAGAGLLIETFTNLLNTNPGFDPHPILTLQTWTTGQKFTPLPHDATPAEENTRAAEISQFYQRILGKVRAIPGVQSAAVVGEGLPFETGGNDFVWLPSQGESHGISSDIRTVSLDYFRTLGIPLVQGRLFSRADSPDAAKVVILNQEFVRKKFPHENPIGQNLNEGGTVREIVGVVGDVKSSVYGNDVTQGFSIPPTVFIPLAQDSGEIQGFQVWIPAYIVLRTAQPPLSLSHALEAAVHGADPNLPLGHIESMEQILSTSLSFQKFSMMLMSIFAGLALILAAVGIFGLMSYSVVQRTHEIGIRMALGARQKDVVAMVVRHGMLLACIGLGCGIAGAIAITRLLASQLYGVQPLDPAIFAIVLIALSLTVFLACYVPARRAARVDPLVALRYE